MTATGLARGARMLFVGGPWHGRTVVDRPDSFVLAADPLDSTAPPTVYVPRKVALAGTYLVTVMAPNTASLPDVAHMLSDVIHERFGIDRPQDPRE